MFVFCVRFKRDTLPLVIDKPMSTFFDSCLDLNRAVRVNGVRSFCSYINSNMS